MTLPDATLYARDLDGTGSPHVCSVGDPGAFLYYREDVIAGAPPKAPMTSAEINGIIDRLIRIKDNTADRSTRDTINDACNALKGALPLDPKSST